MGPLARIGWTARSQGAEGDLRRIAPLEALGAGGQSRPRWTAQACKCVGETPMHRGKAVCEAGGTEIARLP